MSTLVLKKRIAETCYIIVKSEFKPVEKKIVQLKEQIKSKITNRNKFRSKTFSTVENAKTKDKSSATLQGWTKCLTMCFTNNRTVI